MKADATTCLKINFTLLYHNQVSWQNEISSLKGILSSIMHDCIILDKIPFNDKISCLLLSSCYLTFESKSKQN